MLKAVGRRLALRSKAKPRKKQDRAVESFAQRLRAVRSKRGLSQMKLALSAGVNLAYLGRVERAEAAPTLEIVGRLATALAVDVADLVAPQPDKDASLRALRESVGSSLNRVVQQADRPTLEMVAFIANVIQRAQEAKR